MQIGFLLNHSEPHQLPHIAPYAFALSRLKPDWDVVLLCSSEAERAYAEDMRKLYPGARAKVERLHVPMLAEVTDRLVRNFAFYRKRAVQRANIARFARLDALVVPEITSLALKENPALDRLKLVFTGHGAGDLFSNPFGMFDERVARFDLVLLQGRRIAHALARHGRLEGVRYAVIGYPKFETTLAPRQRFFDNDDPVIVYNPTQNPRGSSWHRFGEAVLDHFAVREDLNLIFAPHALLFKRAWTRGARMPGRFRSGPRLRIDLGSRASFDMTYARAADLYLGDQSSQVYEFIEEPRPCVFLNASETGWRDHPDYRSWSFGPVVERAEDLGPAIDAALGDFARWRPAQQAALDEDAPRPDAPYAQAAASERGARAIAAYAETGEIAEAWR